MKTTLSAIFSCISNSDSGKANPPAERDNLKIVQLSFRRGKCLNSAFKFQQVEHNVVNDTETPLLLQDLQKLLEMMRVWTLLVLVTLLSSSSSAAIEEKESAFCGKIRLQSPFMDHSNSSTTSSSSLSDMIVCRSEKLYFRTSIGLFLIVSIDYQARTLTVVPDDPQSCSQSTIYVSPNLLSAGLPSQPNSVLLFNCRNQAHLKSYPVQKCSGTYNCSTVYASEGHSCLVIDDIEKLGNGFHPGNLNCSHYLHVHRSSSNGESGYDYKTGMKVSFEFDHKPDLCQECRRLDGRCGVGLKCFCHLAQCVDKVVTRSAAIRYRRKVFISFLFSTCILFGFLLHKI